MEYRKAGYSKKFLEAHTQAIQMHRRAKQSFDKLGVKKIPKVKELNQQISECYDKKKNMMEEEQCLKSQLEIKFHEGRDFCLLCSLLYLPYFEQRRFTKDMC